ncbi:pogo transposable element with KRAB [Trichonephila clavipes]|nr:pogo transposable element with KRAB [Trichonephila clavipes]
MLDWFQEVWKKREGAFFNSKGVLFMDFMRAHIKDSVKTEAKKNIVLELCVIPGGLTKILQPLDISVNRSFKSHVWACWENWMSAGLHTSTKLGNMRRASYTEKPKVSINPGKVFTIRSGFIKVGIVSESEEITDRVKIVMLTMNFRTLFPKIN